MELRNFGVFEVRWRKPSQARNPRTGEKVMVPERCTVKFKPGRVMEERVESESRSGAAGRKAGPKGSKTESSLGVGAARPGD